GGAPAPPNRGGSPARCRWAPAAAHRGAAPARRRWRRGGRSRHCQARPGWEGEGRARPAAGGCVLSSFGGGGLRGRRSARRQLSALGLELLLVDQVHGAPQPAEGEVGSEHLARIADARRDLGPLDATVGNEVEGEPPFVVALVAVENQ